MTGATRHTVSCYPSYPKRRRPPAKLLERAEIRTQNLLIKIQLLRRRK
jgi:hypothetical protein